ncbi:asparagine synthase (glutamine-hydrolyzing) [Geobacter sulfurreducens]|uniref:asparagine synthase (glutamine-hydrolyzing) n=1 Tax=Geobacter sulfurreducens TaxID=35554 RepID=UPI000DBB1F51|nr:asparagine synthase (glutamine-hydrolyzing) [Geobacter sulfurreducens]BBA70448.1 Asparagine synthetase [glutamine-hydrolyzing] 1 [Geobacter sulfurreducens]
MCGIVGKYYFKQNSVDGNDIDAMMQAIYHRGPDSSGKYINGRVALGFQRLSIIDTVSGHQPLYNETKTIVLLANGEIYNYKEFVPLLESKGHVFSTRSDCEVIIHLYEEYGIQFISKLNGMFAFCLYDTRNDVMFIARDRVGIKPIYYHVNKEAIVFGSEIKGILASDEVVTDEAKDSLAEYLCFRYLANFRTFFSSVNALEPGTYIRISPSGCTFETFWDLSRYVLNYAQGGDLVETIDFALKSSVQRQMMTDVPLGTQLSGGVDSSLVSKLAARYSPGLKTFTVSFFESAYDESAYARLLADSAGLEYHQIRVDGKTFADTLPKVIWYHDEPLCHANSVHMYLLCTYARQFVTVLLTGEGADELFAGYPRYQICRFGDAYNKLNPSVASLVKSVLKGVPARKIAKIVDNLGLGARELALWNSSFATKEKVSWLLNSGDVALDARSALVDSVWNDELSLFDNLLLYEQKSYLQPILMRQDKMSMAASVESRVPVLDNEMLNVANAIPYQYKVRHFTPKHVFKKVAERHISRKIVYKKKVGFGVPVDEWLRDNSGMGRYLDLLLDTARGINGVSRPRLEQLVSEHVSRKYNHGDVLWPLVNYAIWREQFFK